MMRGRGPAAVPPARHRLGARRCCGSATGRTRRTSAFLRHRRAAAGAGARAAAPRGARSGSRTSRSPASACSTSAGSRRTSCCCASCRGSAGTGYAEGASFVLLAFFLTWSCDTGAYAVGRAARAATGRGRGSRRASRSRARSAGWSCAMVAAFVARAWFAPYLAVRDALALGALVGVFAQVGDLVESLLKRDARARRLVRPDPRPRRRARPLRQPLLRRADRLLLPADRRLPACRDDGAAHVLGSTGSIGAQALEVVARAAATALAVVGLAAGRRRSRALCDAGARGCGRAALALERAADPDAARARGCARPSPGRARVRGRGRGGARWSPRREADVVVNGIVGAAGLAASLATLERGRAPGARQQGDAGDRRAAGARARSRAAASWCRSTASTAPRSSASAGGRPRRWRG